MSLLNKNPFPQPAAVDESRLLMLEHMKIELDSFAQFYSLMLNKCNDKCVVPGKGPAMVGEELSIGEQTCLDRCVTKFMETQTYVTQVMQKKNEMMQENAMNAAQMGAGMGAPGMPPGGPR